METNMQDDEDADPADDLALLADLRGWQMTRFGLRLTQIGMAVSVVTAFPAGMVCAFFPGGQAESDAVAVFGYIIAGVFLTSIFAYCGGRYVCCVVPVESSAREHALRSAVCLSLQAVALGACFFLLGISHADAGRVGDDTPGRAIFRTLCFLLVFAIHSMDHLISCSSFALQPSD